LLPHLHLPSFPTRRSSDLFVPMTVLRAFGGAAPRGVKLGDFQKFRQSNSRLPGDSDAKILPCFGIDSAGAAPPARSDEHFDVQRSEERRVGKEWRARW